MLMAKCWIMEDYFPVTYLVFSSQSHLETPAPVVDSGFHCDTNSSGVWYSRLKWGRTAL